MKKYAFFLGIIFFVRLDLKAQQSVVDSNIVLLNMLEERYKSPCIKYEQYKVKRRAIKVDRNVIVDLNKIYRESWQLDNLIGLLRKKGYKPSSRIKQQSDSILLFTKVTEGNLSGYVRVVYNVETRKVLSKKVILGTKKGFFCETKELWSNSSIDFVYLRRFINKIEIPLQVAWSNAELESK